MIGLTPHSKRHILWFKEVSKNDIEQVGGKNSNLGEMYNELAEKHVPVPNGFAVTAEAYKYFVKETGIGQRIQAALAKLDTKDLHNLQENGKIIRKLIESARMPIKLRKSIVAAYRKLSQEYDTDDTDVAVRSSATAEDLPGASFAGQQETYLNVNGERNLIVSVKKCFASLFTDRAMSYREDKGFEHDKVFISVAVQKMVRSDKASAGVSFTIDTESGFKDVVFINAAYGLGEYVVKGVVTPDEFYVHKPTLKHGFKSLIVKRLGDKRKKLIYSSYGTRTSAVSKAEQERFSLSDEDVLKIAKYSVIIEDHYKAPMDIEWAKDGETGKLFIVQARPETVHAMKEGAHYEDYILEKKGKIVTTGLAVGEKIGRGVANKIASPRDIHKFEKGQVLVTTMTDPDWEPIMKIASAIVTNKGGRTCHAAIISRELGIPCVVGTKDATRKIKQGQTVTVSCSEGDEGRVYDGSLPFRVKVTNLKEVPTTRTDVMMNVGLPENAFKLGQLPSAGIGLAREEFIIGEHIGIHPLALIHYASLKEKKKDPMTQRELKKIDKLTKGYADDEKHKFYVEKLAQGVAMLGAGFYPRTVIVRFSDFKSNEYKNLLGGKIFEPHEENPMIGWRGASRYYGKDFRPAFELECEAIKKVREEFGLRNVKVMIPFCRTLKEAKQVLEVMEHSGLKSGENDLEVYMMVEIPSDVILLEDFAKLFDGFSIGSNDLTQLTLGLDRDSELISDIFDERNPAVLNLIASAIRTAKRCGKKIGICGDAQSTYPDFAEFLVKQGIDSMSISPDVFLKAKLLVAKIEQKLKEE